jgi:hypothetical protein
MVGLLSRTSVVSTEPQHDVSKRGMPRHFRVLGPERANHRFREFSRSGRAARVHTGSKSDATGSSRIINYRPPIHVPLAESCTNSLLGILLAHYIALPPSAALIERDVAGGRIYTSPAWNERRVDRLERLPRAATRRSQRLRSLGHASRRNKVSASSPSRNRIKVADSLIDKPSRIPPIQPERNFL